MKKHLNLALVLVLGILGGLLSRYMVPSTAFAQNVPPLVPRADKAPTDPAIPFQIQAQSFALTDRTGRILGTFRFEGDRVVLRDSNRREIWSAGGSPFRAPSER
jgi:hypothetical protein